MNDRTFKIADRYKLTGKFAARALGHYSRRIRNGEMPRAIYADLTSPDCFGRSVNAKVEGGIYHPEIGAAPAVSDERAMHEAFKRFAATFDLPAPSEPKWPEPPKEEEPKPELGAGEGEGKPEDGEEGDDEGKDSKGDETEDKGDDGKADKPKDDSKDDGEEGDAGSADEDKPGLASDGEDAEGDEGESGESGDGDSDSEEFVNEGGEAEGEDGKGSSKALPPPTELNLHNELPDLSRFERGTEMPAPEVTPLERDTSSHDHELVADKLGSAALLAKVREDLMSISRHRVTRNRDSGHVDVETKTAELAGGVDLERVFYTSTQAKRLNAAVQILMDASGSMLNGHGSRMAMCCKLTYLLATTFEKLRVPVQIIACTGYPWLVKDWHEKVDACSILNVSSRGGNHLPYVMEQTIPLLAKRREQRLIQVVTTDGDVGWQTEASFEYYRSMDAALPDASITPCPGRKGGWPTNRINRKDGESEYAFQCRHQAWSQQRAIALRGSYRGDDGPDIRNDHNYKKSVNMEQRLLKLYRDNPRIQTYAFGIETDIPPGIFHRAFNALHHETMTETIIATITHALTHR
jgi:hypothetical protein